MVLHNPNNWHWVNKDVAWWAKEYLGKTLIGLSAEEDGVSAKTTKLVSLDGDVDVSQRKGKVITLFDVQLNLEYEGKTSSGEDVSGSIKIPEVAHDTEADEYVFNISIYAESLAKQPVKDLVRTKICPQLRAELQKLAPALIAEHSKDIQHAPGENPADKFKPASTYNPATNRFEPPSESKKTTTSTTTTSTTKTAETKKEHALINTTTVTASDEFRTTASELYTTFTDPHRIAAFTRGPPRQFDGPTATVGGKFAIFDGNVQGEYTKLDAPKSIEQKWRLAQWPEGHFANLKITFDQNDIDSVTGMGAVFEGVPVGQEEVVKRNWEGYYVRSIKATFGFGTLL